MCTLAFEFAPGTALPLVVAANRDESRARPSLPLQLWTDPRCIAPKDAKEGGTWLGLNASGVFVAITNRFQSENVLNRRSRGLLVLDALRRPSAKGVHEWLLELGDGHFNDFHLVYADAVSGFITWSDAGQLSHTELTPGLHVVTERSFKHSTVARETLVRRLWPSPVDDAPALMKLMGTQADPSFDGLSVHLPEYDYGTKSSFVLLRHAELGRSRCWFADGPPDETAFTEMTSLVQALTAPRP